MKDYYLISGGRSAVNTWDVVFARNIAGNDVDSAAGWDAKIDSRVYTLTLIDGGASDAFFTAHATPTYIPNVTFVNCQVCDVTCATCSGPLTTDCTSCPTGTTRTHVNMLQLVLTRSTAI